MIYVPNCQNSFHNRLHFVRDCARNALDLFALIAQLQLSAQQIIRRFCERRPGASTNYNSDAGNDSGASGRIEFGNNLRFFS